MRLFFIILYVLLIFSYTATSQISEGGIPYSWEKEDIKPSANILLHTEKYNYEKTEKINNKAPFKFAQVIDIQINNKDNGEWFVQPNGDKIWQVAIKSKGAYSLNFNFSQFIIPIGAKVFVFSPNKKYLLGAFTHNNMKSWNGLCIAPIKGDEIIIEYYEPANADFEGILEIDRVAHDFVNIFNQKDGYFGDADNCNININCTQGDNWQKEKRAVCRLIVNNDILCTGTLLNNTRNDETPYVLTANHCVYSDERAKKTIFWFNYETDDCSGTKDGNDTQSISGAKLIAKKNKDNGYLDFSLLKLSGRVPKEYNPYFAAWYVGSQIAKSTTCIHHPKGDVKKISIDNDMPELTSYNGTNYDANTFWLVKKWEYGTTEKGSSGSAIFNENHQVIGTLSGGYATCDNPVKDIYQMISASYNKYNKDSMQLKKWLNPDNLPLKQINAYDPKNKTSIKEINAFFHWNTSSDTLSTIIKNGNYISGTSSNDDQAKAEYFDINELNNKKMIIGGYAFFSVAKGNDNTDVEFFLMNENNQKPNKKIASKTIKLKQIKQDVENNSPTAFLFDQSVEAVSGVYIGVVLPKNAGDTLVVFNTLPTPNKNTAWEMNKNNEWLPYSHTKSHNINATNAFLLNVGNITSTKNKPNYLQKIDVYPNPASEKINIEFAKFEKNVKLYIYNMMGKMVCNKNIGSVKRYVFDLQHIISGFYVVVCQTDKHVFTKKMVIKH